MVLQQLQDAVNAATNAPLCDATDSSVAQATFHKCVASWTYGLVDGLSAEPSIDAVASQDCNATLSRCIFPENTTSCEVTAESNGAQVFATTFEFGGLVGGPTRTVTFEWTDGPPATDAQEASATTLAESGSVDCPVRVTLLQNGIVNNNQAWMALVETCDAFTHWDITLLGQEGVGKPSERYESVEVPIDVNIPGIGFSIYAGETLIAQGEVAAGDTFSGTGTAPVNSSSSSEELVAGPDQVICSATLSNGSFRFSCEEELTVNSYTSTTSEEEITSTSSGDEQSVFQYNSDITFARVVAYPPTGIVFDQTFSNPATADIKWDFFVPVQEAESEYDEPNFSGGIDLSEGDNSVSFTVPDDYSLQDLWLDLTFECESQEIEASVSRQGVYMASFVDPGFPVGLPEGVCLINLYITGSEFLVPGETYDVVITSETDAQITWDGTVELEGDGVSFGEESLEEPYFSGVFNPTTGEDTVSFTIPNNYSASYFALELYADCEDQSIEAAFNTPGGPENFTDMADFHVLGEGLCGVWLIADDASMIPRGMTFEVVIRTATDAQISWSGTVALEGDGVSRDGGTVSEGDQELVWEELFSGEIDAEHYMTLDIPEGGRQVDVRGITTRFENQEEFVDPYLVIFDDTDDVVAWNNDGGEEYGYGDYSSRLYVFLEEGSYTLLATTYDLFYGDDQYPTTYDLELRVGSVPVPADQVAPSGDSPEEQQVQVEVLDAPLSNLEEPKPVFALPVNEVINRDKSSNEPNPVIPAGVTEVVCDSGCLLALREAAGVSEGVVTIQIGGEVIEVQPGVRKAIIPVRPSAKEILVTVTPTDGGEPVVLSTEVLVISPRTFPTKMVEGAKSVVKTNQGIEGLPTNLIVVLSVLALAIAIGLVRRNKVRIPE
jgi:hypothetical protein